MATPLASALAALQEARARRKQLETELASYDVSATQAEVGDPEWTAEWHDRYEYEQHLRKTLDSFDAEVLLPLREALEEAYDDTYGLSYCGGNRLPYPERSASHLCSCGMLVSDFDEALVSCEYSPVECKLCRYAPCDGSC